MNTLMPVMVNIKSACASLMALCFTTSLLTGCASKVTHQQLADEGLAIDAPGYFTSGKFRKILSTERENPATPKVGLALAGGGTKAADFSLGVIQGLDETGLMPEIDYISTVSGGSYAGLWYYARSMLDRDAFLDKTIYHDCLPFRYIPGSGLETGSSTSVDINECPRFNLTGFTPENKDQYRFQNYLRGYQDIFSYGTDLFGNRAFKYSTSDDHTRLTNDIGQLILETLASSVINVIPNIVFDWEQQISPSRKAYRHGIARTFGASPPRCPDGCGDESDHTAPKLTREGTTPWDHDSAMADRSYRAEGTIKTVENLPFELLKALHETSKLPVWIINTTAGEDRSPWDFTDQAHPELTVFEFTPYGYGSGIYRYFQRNEDTATDPLARISPLNAVINSAAFFDEQQKVMLDPVSRKLVAGLMRASTLNWGTSYTNPNVTPLTRAIHNLLPWPVYYLHRFNAGRDSAYVHLSDGGMSENLGAYSLVRRGVDTLILSDNAYDRNGRMGDVCRLKSSLRQRGFRLLVPGLAHFETICQESENDTRQRHGYDIFDWPHPVLLGCIVPNDAPADCTRIPESWDRQTGRYTARVFILKPAFANQDLEQALRNLSAHGCQNGHCEYLAQACRDSNGQIRTGKNVWVYDKPIPCEILTFMAFNSFRHGVLNSRDGCPEFPQYSTISMTLSSSPWMYGASRELGQYYARQLKPYFINGAPDTQWFNTVIRFQGQPSGQIKAYPSPGSLFGSAKAGTPGECLGLEDRH